MSTKGSIKKVRWVHGIVLTYPKFFVIDEFKDAPDSIKLYIFRGQFSGRVNDVELPID